MIRLRATDFTSRCRHLLPGGAIPRAHLPEFRNFRILLDSPVGTGVLRFGPVPLRGAARDRHGRGAGCGGRGCALDEWRGGGRRSRVVLTPRRWCQVRESNFADDGGKRARSPGRARRKPLKPLRGECRVNRCDLTNACALYHYLCTRGSGRIGRPAFPAPSDWRERQVASQTRASRAARSRRRV
jgi:hypothetical protein